MALNVKAAINLPVLATRPQVAAALGLSTKTIQRAELRGHIQPVRIGRSVLFTIEQVQQYASKLTK